MDFGLTGGGKQRRVSAREHSNAESVSFRAEHCQKDEVDVGRSQPLDAGCFTSSSSSSTYTVGCDQEVSPPPSWSPAFFLFSSSTPPCTWFFSPQPSPKIRADYPTVPELPPSFPPSPVLILSSAFLALSAHLQRCHCLNPPLCLALITLSVSHAAISPLWNSALLINPFNVGS